jgi:hypothetical protein
MVDRPTYDAKLRAIAAMIADDQMNVVVADEIARLFGMITSTADDEMCELVALVVVDAMKAMREYDRTTAASVAAE